VEHLRVISTSPAGTQTVEAQKRTATDITAKILAALREEKLHWRATKNKIRRRSNVR